MTFCWLLLILTYKLLKAHIFPHHTYFLLSLKPTTPPDLAKKKTYYPSWCFQRRHPNPTPPPPQWRSLPTVINIELSKKKTSIRIFHNIFSLNNTINNSIYKHNHKCILKISNSIKINQKNIIFCWTFLCIA